MAKPSDPKSSYLHFEADGVTHEADVVDPELELRSLLLRANPLADHEHAGEGFTREADEVVLVQSPLEDRERSLEGEEKW